MSPLVPGYSEDLRGGVRSSESDCLSGAFEPRQFLPKAHPGGIRAEHVEKPRFEAIHPRREYHIPLQETLVVDGGWWLGSSLGLIYGVGA